MTAIVGQISRPYATQPGPIHHALMEALDSYLHAHEDDGQTWEAFDALIVGFGRACRFGDSTCACGSDVLNFPHRLQASGDGWRATYSCRACGVLYDCWWSDNW
jgi:hypothetical protein